MAKNHSLVSNRRWFTMKKITTLVWVLALPLLALAQQATNPKISSTLAQQMQANPTKAHEIIISLADYVDARALLIRYENEKTPLEQRGVEVVTLLQQKANATQPVLVSRLENLQGVEKGSIAQLWIINAIYCHADAEAIIRMADWAEVGEISENYALENEYGTNPTPSASTPNGSEPGLRAIKAPFMWNKGYTGYGRKGLIIDTGQDHDHPALLCNFWGNNVARDQAWHGSKWPEDCADHGSHVAGIIVGLDRKTNDTIGVAYNAHWLGAPMFFPISTEGTGCDQAFNQTIFDNVNSLQWALNPDGVTSTTADQPDIVNNSWRAGNVDCSTTAAKNAINALEAAGIAVVFAQGNAGPNPSTVTSGAGINTDLVNTFAVGAVNGANPSFPIADFSSRGPSQCGGTGALSIKPEVVAPGVSVRSSFNNGEYSSIDGTSMAAPHAAGAILLLREAFPTLSGTTLKLALYNSATELGAAGEDNTYGKGMINLESAFNQLVADGNVPATPVAFNKDAILADLKPVGLCNGPVKFTLGVENGGTEAITSLKFTYGILNGVTSTHTWTGNLAPKVYETINLPGLEGVLPGDHVAIVTIDQINGGADNRTLNNNFRMPFTMANDEYATAVTSSAQTQPVCAGSRVLLTYDTGLETNEVPQWYSLPAGGSVLGEGKTFLTPTLNANTTFYVTASRIFNIGKNTFSGTNSFTEGGSLEFNATKPFRLKTVLVKADEVGVRVIQLTNNIGAVLATKNVNITQVGESRITLNFNVPEGSGYELTLDPGGKTLAQTGTPAGYPHTVQGVASIVRGITAAGSNTSFSYFYFFDWEIEVPMDCGRTPVPVTVSPSPSAQAVTFDASNTTVALPVGGGTADVALTNTTSNSSNLFWSFGNGQTSTAANPTASYAAVGTYKVHLLATTANGCSNGAEKIITVSPSSGTNDGPSLLERAILYPNPATNTLQIAFEDGYGPDGANVRLFDMLGRAVLTKNNAVQGSNAQLDIAALAPGIYFVNVEDNGRLVWRSKFVKQ
jgi:hypothetical protein